MAKDQGAIPTTIRPRGAARAPSTEPPRKGFSLVDWVNSAPKFFREVRAEARKVSWTSWKETWITSVMVGIMVVVTALFFFSVDGVFNFAMEWVLKAMSGSGT